MKMNNLLLGSFAVAVLVTGCYSFNRIEISEKSSGINTVNAEEIALRSRQETENVIKRIGWSNRKVCPPFVAPALPKTPELPFDELSKINPNDTAALDAIQTKHIDDLRQYVIKIKTIIDDAQKEHAAKCQSTMMVNSSVN